MNIDVTDLTILFVIFAAICYQLYDAQLLTYPTKNMSQEWILLAVLIVFNLWATFFISANNFSLWTSSKNCIVSCPKILKPLLKTRGDNYFLNKDGPTPEAELRNCLLSTWGLSHIIMYALITFIVPRLWWVVLISGIVWEIYESKHLGCQDFLDIGWDSLGVYMGYSLAKKCKWSSVYSKETLETTKRLIDDFKHIHKKTTPPATPASPKSSPPASPPKSSPPASPKSSHHSSPPKSSPASPKSSPPASPKSSPQSSHHSSPPASSHSSQPASSHHSSPQSSHSSQPASSHSSQPASPQSVTRPLSTEDGLRNSIVD